MDYPHDDQSARLHPATNKFTDGDIAQAIPASKDAADYQNMVFDELIHLITESGQTPSFNDRAQVFKAIQALVAEKPLGEPYWHLGSQPPVGSMEFKGQLLSRAVYAELWQALNESGRNLSIVSDTVWLGGRTGVWSTGNVAANFRVPRMTGNFIRVLDTAGLIDPGRIIGDLQLDELKAHSHTTPVPNSGYSFENHQYNSRAAKHANTDTVSSTTGGNETRPRNIAWMLCFRYQ